MIRTTALYLALLTAIVGCAQAPMIADNVAISRPSHWGEPIALPGVPNLHRIDAHLYRSEQPSAEGFRNLEKLGIRTVINLRHFNSDASEARGTSLRLERVKILTWSIDDEHVIEVMRMLQDKEQGPFLIHCQHGADRTGLMSAMYRMLEQSWTAQEALSELVDGGYGFHKVWKNIERYVLSADVAALRAAIAAGAPSSASDSTRTVTDN